MSEFNKANSPQVDRSILGFDNGDEPFVSPFARRMKSARRRRSNSDDDDYATAAAMATDLYDELESQSERDSSRG